MMTKKEIIKEREQLLRDYEKDYSVPNYTIESMTELLNNALELVPPSRKLTMEDYFELSRSFATTNKMTPQMEILHNAIFLCVKAELFNSMKEVVDGNDLRAFAHVVCCKYNGDNPGTNDENHLSRFGDVIASRMLMNMKKTFDELEINI